MRRKAELERDLHRARGTAFESPDLSQASIGTIITLRETTNGGKRPYTILGAWDGDPDRAIISYQTAIGQSLLGRRLGEVVELNAEEDTAATPSLLSSRPRWTKSRLTRTPRAGRVRIIRRSSPRRPPSGDGAKTRFRGRADSRASHSEASPSSGFRFGLRNVSRDNEGS
jgi:hypothetical protein